VLRVVRCRGAVAAIATVALACLTLSNAATAAAGSPDFSTAVDAMRARIRDDGLTGGELLVARADGTTLEDARFGDVTPSTAMPIASASKWITAATAMTFVDEGQLSLDDPVAKYLPAFTGDKATVTVRQALSHTSGLPPNECAGDPDVSLAACVRRIAANTDDVRRPGTAFRYTSVGYVVVGRIIEKLAGVPYQQAFEHRLGRAVGMTHTTFTRRGEAPDPAGSARSTPADYRRFVAMLAARGTVGNRRVLSAAAVDEIERDQVRGLDTHTDPAVAITGIPTYGLGVWRDVVGAGDAIQVVSGNGAFGFYPWIDRAHGTFGIVAVADQVDGPAHAVPASQRIARLSWAAAASAG
jgi:serine-type D-Ala-D-Ala carboxypeptidase/endopeptidase